MTIVTCHTCGIRVDTGTGSEGGKLSLPFGWLAITIWSTPQINAAFCSEHKPDPLAIMTPTPPVAAE